MNLNLFENFKRNNNRVNNFIEKLNSFLNNINLSKNNSSELDESAMPKNNLQKNRKEGHLYLVTEDRNNEIYLWDFTEKSKSEFKEKIYSEDLLKVAKEGAMLQYINGKYELYSPYGFDIVEKEKNNQN